MASSSRVAGVFPIPGHDETFVVAEWFPDPKIIEQEIIAMADAFEDWTEPLLEARAAMIESTRIHFETESDPYGDAWAALDEDYKNSKVAAGFPEDILIRTGDLERAATSEGAWFITERSIMFNVAALPPYGPIHQEGTAEGAAAGKLGAALDISIGGRTLSAEEAAIIGKGGSGLNLPQRMFIGADVDTIAEIEAIFLRHLDKTVTDNWVGGGIDISGPEMGENVMGRFPIVGYTKRGQPLLRTPKGIRFGRRI